MDAQQSQPDYGQLDRKYYLPVFKRVPLTLVKGTGFYVWDDRGNKYLDALAGIAVNALGHCHPEVVGSIQDQAATLIHISNFYVSPPQAELARKLAQLSGLDRVFMTNSGGESVETAIKLARKFSHARDRGGEVITFEGCFHGRTLATAAAGDSKYQQGFEPMPAGFTQLPFNDVAALEAAVSSDTAGIMLEPIQGEGGVRPAASEFVTAARRLCNEQGPALIFDEVQCGLARTGKWFAGEHYGVKPDILALAKGLGGGFPVGAALCSERVAQAIKFGDHGSTFGGNPLACRAALATLNVIERDNLVAYVADQGERLLKRLSEAAAGQTHIAEVRGKGLMIGVELDFPGAGVVDAMRARGVLANCARERVMRLVPPLITPGPELDRMVDVLLAAIEECGEHG